MNRLLHCPLLVIGVLVAFLNAQSVNAAQKQYIKYAEHMPLVTKSLLLDITRSAGTLVAVGERGHVITSSDGVNWKQAKVVPTRSTLTTVFSLGKRLWAAGHDATIISSGDQGQTWTRQFFDPGRQQAVMDIFFSDENNGTAIGSYGLYLRTSDGGQSWQDARVDEESDFHLNGMLRFADGRRLIAGEAGYSYRSYDDGKTWEAIKLPYQGSMWGAVKTSGNCVLFFGLLGHVLQSCDFGSSWTELESGTKSSISGAATDGDEVLLVANSGTLLIRKNGGDFKLYHHSSGVDFAAAIAIANGNFLLVGEHGVQRYPEPSVAGGKQ